MFKQELLNAGKNDNAPSDPLSKSVLRIFCRRKGPGLRHYVLCDQFLNRSNLHFPETEVKAFSLSQIRLINTLLPKTRKRKKHEAYDRSGKQRKDPIVRCNWPECTTLISQVAQTRADVYEGMCIICFKNEMLRPLRHHKVWE